MTDARAKLRGELHLQELLSEALSPEAREESFREADAARAAYLAIGLLSSEAAETWHERFERARSTPASGRVPAEETREGARRHLEALRDSLQTSDAEEEARRQLGGALSAAVSALWEAGAISFEELGTWLGRIHEVSGGQAAMEGIFIFGSGPVAGIAGAEMADEEGDDEPAAAESWPRGTYFEGRTLLRVVTARPNRHSGLAVTAAELYADGVRIEWHAVRPAHLPDEHPPSPRPGPPGPGFLDEHEDAFTEWFGAGGVTGLRDDLGTRYEPQLDGGDWSARRPRARLGTTTFTPAAPEAARELVVETGDESVSIPLEE
jgi:hypothetical protein